MKTQSRDTSAEVEQMLVARLRMAGPERRLEMALDASRAIRQLAWNGLRLRHPRANEAELRWRYVALVFGDEAAIRVFGSFMPS